jgi:hypothetical protein
MRIIIITIGIAFFLKPTCLAQVKDAVLAKKVTINGYCLCTTTLTGLKESDASVKAVDVEEMDLAKGCYSQDSRYIAGKGYHTDKQPGLIFQKDPDNDFISKIRLTKAFKGNLPDGKSVDLSTLTLGKLFVLYPTLKSTWGSRDCSDYWNFSNDTLSFYVKIDKSKKPQFPIDEAYYLDKPIEGADLMLSCYSVQKDNENPIVLSKTDPVFFIDSVRVNKWALNAFNADDIASVTVYKDTNAIKLFGPEAKYGLIFIESKMFAKQRYWKYFNAKSAEYSKVVLIPGAEFDVQYILNNRILKNNFEGDLAAIDDKIFKSIRIIDQKELKKEFGITDKAYGVIITSDIPANLKNGKSKF